MSLPSASVVLSFADVQMAAEAINLDRVLRNELTLAAALIEGNNRSSKFTSEQAAKFASEWTVVDHLGNTGTGFSGTLFKYVGETDPARGLVKDQLVMSFRSTEFADDAVRDNDVTPSTATDYGLCGHLAKALI